MHCRMSQAWPDSPFWGLGFGVHYPKSTSIRAFTYRKKMSAIASRSTVFQASAVRSSMRAVVPKVAARRSLRVVAQAQNEKVRMRCLVTALLWTVTKLHLSNMEMDASLQCWNQRRPFIAYICLRHQLTVGHPLQYPQPSARPAACLSFRAKIIYGHLTSVYGRICI